MIYDSLPLFSGPVRLLPLCRTFAPIWPLAVGNMAVGTGPDCVSVPGIEEMICRSFAGSQSLGGAICSKNHGVSGLSFAEQGATRTVWCGSIPVDWNQI